MKLIITLLMLSSFAQARSIVPELVVTPNLDLFSSKNKTLPNGDVEVQVSKFTKHGALEQNREKKVLTKLQFEAFIKPSLAVYETYPKQDAENSKLTGTAFNIGNNLIITNHHVLDVSFSNKTHCDGFRIKDHDGEVYDCQKVHYCSPEEDVCLIEMEPKTKVHRDCLFCRGTKYTVSLAERPALKLKDNYNPPYHQALEEIYTAIGNSAGFGVHLSQGRGAYFNSDYVRFWAPITSGNSGGPLLNQEGLVVGIVKHQSANMYGTNKEIVFNGAEPAKRAIKLIREALRDDPETLLKFNQSVVE